MRSLACLVALLGAIAVSSSMSACVPDDADLSHPISPSSGPLASGIGQGDNGGGGLEPNVPGLDGGVGNDGGFLLDAGPFLDAFDFPMDAPEPLNPGTDQIP